MKLQGKTAFVTGASSGIGRALAVRLAKAGCHLRLTAIEADLLELLAIQLNDQYGVDVVSHAGDLSHPKDRDQLVSWIRKRPETTDILINNAGIGGTFGRFPDVSLETIDATIAVNVAAFVHLTHDLLPQLLSRPRAKIVNVSSGIARLPYPGLAVYGATKAFVSGFSQSLACELAGSSVDVLCFHPGFTDTAFVKTSRMDLAKIPRRMIHDPEWMATRIVRAIERDSQWSYSDLMTHSMASIGAVLPARLKTWLFKSLFWTLPAPKDHCGHHPESTGVSDHGSSN